MTRPGPDEKCSLAAQPCCVFQSWSNFTTKHKFQVQFFPRL